MFIRTALGQINTTVGDFPGNRDRIWDRCAQAEKQGAQLIVFPELSLAGYPPEDLLYRKKFIQDNKKALQNLLPRIQRLVAVVGFVDSDVSGNLYNAAAVIFEKKIQAVYRKCFLPNYGVFDEKRYFSAGKKPLIVALKGIRFGVTICEDIWDPNSFVYDSVYSRHLSFLINLSASPFYAGKEIIRKRLLKKLAKKINRPILYQNLIGGQDELVFDGGGMLIDARGNLIAKAQRFKEELLFADLEVKEFHKAVEKLRAPIGVRPIRGSENIFLQKRSPLPQKSNAVLFSTEAEIYEALILGLKDYVGKNGFSKVVIGLSGGIDSALVAVLAVDALGADNVLGVTLPSRYNAKETHKDALGLAHTLGIRCIDQSIESIFESYLSSLKEIYDDRPADATEENLQARIRGNLLMAISNKQGYLVLATGNKSEIATGYCTLYGDMAGGFAVIKDVPKSMVYRLVRYRNSKSKNPPIAETIIKRAPTAELRPNQKDQDSLPPYEILDEILEAYVEWDLSVDAIVKKGYTEPMVRLIAQLVDKSEYKRRQAPPGIKITPRAFGRDRRLPITNKSVS